MASLGQNRGGPFSFDAASIKPAAPPTPGRGGFIVDGGAWTLRPHTRDADEHRFIQPDCNGLRDTTLRARLTLEPFRIRRAHAAIDPDSIPTRPICGCRSGSPGTFPVTFSDRGERIIVAQNGTAQIDGNAVSAVMRTKKDLNLFTRLEGQMVEHEPAEAGQRSLPQQEHS